MSRNNDFEIVPSTRGGGRTDLSKPDQQTGAKRYASGQDALMHAAADNMGSLIDLAHRALSIQEIQASSAAKIAEYQEERKRIELEAKVYIQKLELENEKSAHKVNRLADMLESFWRTNRSGDELSKELPLILDWLERL